MHRYKISCVDAFTLFAYCTCDTRTCYNCECATWHSPVCTLVFARSHVQNTSASTTHLQSCSEVRAGVRMSALTHTYYLKHKWIMPEIIRVTFRECIGCVCVSGEWQRAAHTHTRTHTHAHTHTRTYTHTYTHTQHTNIHTHRWSKGDTRLWLLVTTCCSVLQCVAVCCSVSTGVTKPGLLVTILESQPIPKFTIRDSFGAGFSKKLPCEPSSTFTRTTTAF